MIRDAVISPCGLFRPVLSRTWEFGDGTMLFVMLNPSKADASIDDPTVGRCVGFAMHFGYAAMEIVNLSDYRATDPHELLRAGCPESDGNFRQWEKSMRAARTVVCAWGAHARSGTLFIRAEQFGQLARDMGVKLHALRLLADGTPGHPLYLPRDSQLVDYPRA